jgi:1-acyl-sn-glycerol-3-phosphate acyltransferase
MIETLQPTAPVQLYPCLYQALPVRHLSEGAYRVRFARNLAELDEVLRLRFEVFNLELREGLEASFATGRDEDELDLACHHLIVEHRESGKIIGTYCLQSPERPPVAWFRLFATAPVILGAGAVEALGAAVLAFAPRSRRRFLAWLFGATSRALLALLRTEVRVSGPLPRAPFLLVTNHLGYLDILVLASKLPARFVAKAEVRRWPLLGPICKGFGTIFIDRSDRRDIPRVLAEIEAALARGEGVIVFPEGTSFSGEEVHPFRSPLLALPARRGLPVHAAALGYDPPEVAWWGDAALLPHLIGLFRLRRIKATIDFAAEPIVDGDRKRLAERLREAVVVLAPQGAKACSLGRQPAHAPGNRPRQALSPEGATADPRWEEDCHRLSGALAWGWALHAWAPSEPSPLGRVVDGPGLADVDRHSPRELCPELVGGTLEPFQQIVLDFRAQLARHGVDVRDELQILRPGGLQPVHRNPPRGGLGPGDQLFLGRTK